MDGTPAFPGEPGGVPMHAHAYVPGQPLGSAYAPGSIPLRTHAHPGWPVGGARVGGPSAKTPADYVRAVVRQVWLVLAIAVLISTAGALFVLRMKAIYRAESEITIKAPEYDAIVSHLVTSDKFTVVDKEAQATYVPDRMAYLRSKSLVEQIVRDPTVSGPRGPASVDEAAAELIENLTTRNYTGTSFFKITLEGEDPAKVTRTLRLLLEKFKDQADVESRDLLEQSKLQASASLTSFSKELRTLDEQIYALGRGQLALALGGRSVLQDRYESVSATLLQKRMRFDETERELRMEAQHPRRESSPLEDSRNAQLAKLAEDERMIRNRLAHAKRTIRGSYYNDDPTVRYLMTQLAQIARMREGVVSGPEEIAPPDLSEQILASARADIEVYETESRELLQKLQEAVPDHAKYMTLTEERERKANQIAAIQEKLSEFEILMKTQKPPVQIVVPAVEPITPVRPKRALSIALFVVLGFGLGIGLACFREYLDHSVKVPEHLSAGLTLPLLGVIPRIPRTSRNHRGGHLWTPGAPESTAADAYRNLRAGLVGITQASGSFVTLLVTSAKAGEGKSTTALNLAATCARAGERTLLVDIDLRRASLNAVFPHDENHLGLVDVLRGEMPWQRTVVPTDLPNLDFLPTGDTRDVPIEILGSLELRKLLESLSRHHYDRVILDGPAVLGLADCRMLGPMVDAAIVVVRCGESALRPVERAKTMLDQSRVRVVGVVFNGLAEDLDNWSSYGPTPSGFEPPASRTPRLTAGSV
ncbi:MAG: polysaccharide biosynthesis tyrosine autokinase [Isosphaeraceae bacterium]|nr:polysaccharide biosynthesis tyrosine autokinase [Isosphaeraceae bacterium]